MCWDSPHMGLARHLEPIAPTPTCLFGFPFKTATTRSTEPRKKKTKNAPSHPHLGFFLAIAAPSPFPPLPAKAPAPRPPPSAPRAGVGRSAALGVQRYARPLQELRVQNSSPTGRPAVRLSESNECGFLGPSWGYQARNKLSHIFSWGFLSETKGKPTFFRGGVRGNKRQAADCSRF